MVSSLDALDAFIPLLHPLFPVLSLPHGWIFFTLLPANHMCTLCTHPTAMCSKPPHSSTPATHSARERCYAAAELNIPSKHAIAQRQQRSS